MTAAPPRAPDRSERPARVRGLLAALVVAVTTLIVVGHGCHGDDVDHEPAARAPADTSLPPP